MAPFDFRATLSKHRRLWIITLILVLAYTLFGLILVPWIAQQRLVNIVEETLGLQASVDRLRINPYTLTILVEGFAVRESDGKELLSFDELLINFQLSSLFRRAWTIKEIRLVGPRINVVVHEDGGTNLAALFPEPGQSGEAELQSAAEWEGWQVASDRLFVDNLVVSFEDRTVVPAFQTGIHGGHLEVRGMDLAQGSTFDFTLAAKVNGGGSASAEGRLGLLPGPILDALIKLDGLSLVPLQAYLDELARLRIDSGIVSLHGRLTSNAEELLAFRGAIELTDVTCHDVYRDELLVELERLNATDLLLALTAAQLRIESIDLERPYVRLTIFEDGTTNVGDVLAKEVEPASASDTAAPLAIEIGKVRIRDGSSDFSDLSLPLPFSSRIDSIEGGISEMASGGTSAHVDLKGVVGEYGLAQAQGDLDFFAPDRQSAVTVVFQNVEMSQLSPYFLKFAGYAVEEGRLSLDLRYRIEDRRLDSENEILIEQLTLGEKVDSPDAPNLPVKIAVALLKDKDGRIELDIPVGGALDDPEFAYGALVWKAIKSVLKKVATAPFRALARMIGSDKDLELVEFAAAESEITPPTREKLELLARALVQRPELVLEVRGVFDPEIDAAAIREQKLEALVTERIASLPDRKGIETIPASERRRAVLEALFLERFPEEELDGLLAGHTASAEPTLDLPTHLDALRERLIAAQSVTEEELARLADARAVAIGDFLNAGGLVSSKQIHTLPGGPIEEKDADNNWVRIRLAASASN